MGINLRSVAVVTSLGGGLTTLRNLCMHFNFPQSQAEHSYQSYLKYLDEKLTQEIKKEDCIGRVQKRLGTALRSYKNKRRGAVLSNGKGTDGKDPTIDRMQTAYGYAIRNNKAIWAIYHHMIMVPPEESVESQHSYCPNDDKTWCKYHKGKIFNTNIYDRSKCLPFVFCGELQGFLHDS